MELIVNKTPYNFMLHDLHERSQLMDGHFKTCQNFEFLFMERLEEQMGGNDLWGHNVREFLTNGGNYPI